MSFEYAFLPPAKSLQSCPTLCDHIDGSPPGSPIQAGTLEWVAISFSNACKWKVKVKSLSRVWPSATPWSAAFQAPLSMGFSRQGYWSVVPLPSTELNWTDILTRIAKIKKTGNKQILVEIRNNQISQMLLVPEWKGTAALESNFCFL